MTPQGIESANKKGLKNFSRNSKEIFFDNVIKRIAIGTMGKEGTNDMLIHNCWLNDDTFRERNYAEQSRYCCAKGKRGRRGGRRMTAHFKTNGVKSRVKSLFKIFEKRRIKKLRCSSSLSSIKFNLKRRKLIQCT